MSSYQRLRQRSRVRRLVPRITCLLVSLLVLALVVVYPVNHNRYMGIVADGYVGVELENTGEQLLGFAQALETGIKLIVIHDGLLIFVRSVIYRCGQTTQTIGGESQNQSVTVTVDLSYVTGDAFVCTWDDPRDTKHTHDGQAIEINLHDPLWHRKGPMDVRIC